MTVNGSRPLLEVEDLVVRYPVSRGLVGTIGRKPKLNVNAVDGVNLSVRSGELLTLVGESGCGKTTTAQAVLRLIDATSGAIRFEGRDITRLGARSLRPLRRRMQIVYQDPYESLDPRLRVRATVEEPLSVHRLAGSKRERAERVNEALARVDLSPPELFLDRFPHELSGGQRQRVAIAAGLVLEPSLLVADEPVSMLERLGPGRSPPTDRPLARARPGDPDDHARPVDRGALRRPDRRHVPRTHRRGGPGAGSRPQSAASLHEGAALGRPASRSARSHAAPDPHRRDA
jgi:ABC-type dipeptide/oligopeptide/nickel transport system ATPase subunit